MSRRRDIEVRLASLRDIGKIMGSMKNLAYMETRKLARFIDSQQRVVAGIEAAARDFLAHHPGLLESAVDTGTLHVLIGAERGFCGGFNEAILEALKRLPAPPGQVPSPLVAVGGRLAAALEGDPRLIARVQGASAAEEVPGVLSRLAETLDRLSAGRPPRSLTVVHWDAASESVQAVPLLPPFRGPNPAAAPSYPCPPRLNLDPETFVSALIEHHLFAALHALLYSSLLAEHQQRVRHLEGALERIRGRVQGLAQRRNLLRQEEITEEIELMLLNLTEGTGPRGEDPEPGPPPLLAPAAERARR